MQVFEVLHYIVTCVFKVIRMKMERGKAVEAREHRILRNMENNSQETAKPFKEHIAEKENGGCSITETEVQRSQCAQTECSMAVLCNKLNSYKCDKCENYFSQRKCECDHCVTSHQPCPCLLALLEANIRNYSTQNKGELRLWICDMISFDTA